jgi:hypothetical protein
MALEQIKGGLAVGGTFIALIATALSTLNKCKIERVNSQVTALELQGKKEKASMDFASIFLDKVLKEGQLGEHKDKQIQALLSVLNIVALASGNQSGDDVAKAREIIPLQLALLLGEPGALAAMDVDYKYLDTWVALACADNSDKTRVTAIQALGGICQKALRDQRLDVVAKGVEAVDQLLALIPVPKDPKDNLLVPAIAARLQLAAFINKEEKLVDAAKLPPGVPGDETAIRTRIRSAFSDSVQKAQDTNAGLQKVAAGLGKSAAGSETRATVDQSLAQLNAALDSASEAARQQTGVTTSPQPQSPAGASPAAPASSVNVDNLIKELAEADTQRQRQAISQLALLGQPVVKPLLEELAQRFSTSAAPSPEDNKTRVGIANALKLMRQPINLDATDAWWVVSLLSAREPDARDFATDFLTGVFPEETLRNVYAALDVSVEPFLYPNSARPKPLEGSAVYNAAFIVVTWARLLDDTLQSPEKGKSMSAFCKDKASEWKKDLEASPHKPDWHLTIDLLQRASSTGGSTG